MELAFTMAEQTHSSSLTRVFQFLSLEFLSLEMLIKAHIDGYLNRSTRYDRINRLHWKSRVWPKAVRRETRAGKQ